jgi:hypothetical protein
MTNFLTGQEYYRTLGGVLNGYFCFLSKSRKVGSVSMVNIPDFLNMEGPLTLLSTKKNDRRYPQLFHAFLW